MLTNRKPPGGCFYSDRPQFSKTDLGCPDTGSRQSTHKFPPPQRSPCPLDPLQTLPLLYSNRPATPDIPNHNKKPFYPSGPASRARKTKCVTCPFVSPHATQSPCHHPKTAQSAQIFSFYTVSL